MELTNLGEKAGANNPLNAKKYYVLSVLKLNFENTFTNRITSNYTNNSIENLCEEDKNINITSTAMWRDAEVYHLKILTLKLL